MTATDTILHLMQERREATRPQLAAASGLSLVTVNKVVSALCLRGELRLKGSVPSGGGRPVQLYAYNTKHAVYAFFTVQAEQAAFRGTLDICDLGSTLLRRHEARFSMIQPGAADDWLDAAVRRSPLRGIGLNLPPTLPETGLAAHLQTRYGCPVRPLNRAAVLADTRENAVTLYLPQGEAPQAALHRRGQTAPYAALHLLPLPAAWETLDYSDHTMVVETISCLLHILTAVQSPAHITLYADFWTERLLTRIRYTFTTKLRGYEHAPQLHFRTAPTALLLQQADFPHLFEAH